MEKSPKYEKQITQDRGIITAEVKNDKGIVIASKMYNTSFFKFVFSIPPSDKIYKRAHKWCDKIIQKAKTYLTH